MEAGSRNAEIILMSIIHLSHTDLDGISPFVLDRYFGLSFDQELAINYDQIFDAKNKIIFPSNQFYFSGIEDYDDIIITDINVNKEFYNYFKKTFNEVVIFDHHQTTEDISQKDDVHFSLKRSGTGLYFDYLVEEDTPGVVKDFVHLVDVYDLWQTTHEDRERAEDLNRLFYGTLDYRYKDKDGSLDRYRRFIANQLKKLRDGGERFFFSNFEINIINKAKQKEEDAYLEAKKIVKKRTDEKGITFLVYWGRTKISQTCNRLLNDHVDASYIININTYQNHGPEKINGKLSIRSRDEFDVTTLKKIDGHKNAGGGIFDKFIIKKLWRNRNFSLPYEEE
jgi:hypothetical protein